MGRRTKKVGPAGGLGSRYGANVRKRYTDIVSEVKKKHKCPKCEFLKVKRISVGVWECRKCGYTFTGGAYSPETKLGIVAKRTARSAAAELTVERARKENDGE